MNARPRAIFCHSPPDSSTPPSNHLPERRVPAVGQPLEQAVGAALAGRILDRLAVLEPAELAEADVLGGRRLVGHVVLEHPADQSPDGRRLELAQVDAVEEDPARRSGRRAGRGA